MLVTLKGLRICDMETVKTLFNVTIWTNFKLKVASSAMLVKLKGLSVT